MPHPLLFARKMNPHRAECHRKTLATGIDPPGKIASPERMKIRTLGTAFATLPEALKSLHQPGPVVTYDGWLEPARI